MRQQHGARALLPQLLERRKCGLEPGVIGYDAVLQRGIEIESHQNGASLERASKVLQQELSHVDWVGGLLPQPFPLGLDRER